MRGLKTLLGCCCALLIHTSALLFSVIKYVGAIYLLYLGIKTLWSLKKKKEVVSVEMNTKNKFASTSFLKTGLLTNILNPKVAHLFLTFFPQFVNHGSNTLLPFLIVGITYTVMTALWSILYVYLINGISAFMKKPKTQNIIEGITGAILIGFGIRLFLEKPHN